MKTIGRGILLGFGLLIALVIVIVVAQAASNPAVQRALATEPPTDGLGRPIQTPTPTPRFSMNISGCGWPTRGGQQIGRTFHVVIGDSALAKLPLNPLYFKVETPDRRVRQAGVIPFDLDLTALQLITLNPGQTADGWLFFELAPTELATLIYDDGFGESLTLQLSDYTLADGRSCGASTMH